MNSSGRLSLTLMLLIILSFIADVADALGRVNTGFGSFIVGLFCIAALVFVWFGGKD